MAVAQTSPEVAHGVELYLEADFEGAIAELDETLRTRTLDPGDVEIALDRLAAAHSAIGDADGVARVLGRLAVVAPGHLFAADVPVELSAQFVQIMRETPHVTVRIVPGAAGGAPSVAVEDDPWSAVLDTTLECHADGACTAVALGPGRIQIGIARSDAPAHETAGGAGGGLDPLVLGLAIGGGVLALALAIGIGVGVATSGGGGGDGPLQLGAPVVHW